MPATPPNVDPVLLDRTITQLQALTDQAYAQSLADCVVDPEPVEHAAYRSDELAERSLAAAVFLVNTTNSLMKNGPSRDDPAWVHRTQHFLNRIGMERRLLGTIVDGMYARQGRVKNAPNPRRRAQERLWNLVMSGRPVDPQTPALLMADEEAKEKVRKAQDKARRKAARVRG